ncbi:MAG TPA: FtsQ-type POTRA domain-containing protein [Pyrinomonadaceae bacterium]
MREQVITPRAGRAGGAASKGRGAVSVQRPGGRRARPAAQKDSGLGGFDWKSALSYVPAVLKAALAVTLGLLAYLGYSTAVSASFFKVRAVDVSGASRASREEIRAAALRLSNAGAWQADLDVISKELRGLPWVREAVVTRVLPSGLRVRVTEREPRLIARAASGRLVWVDDDGVALGAASPDEEDFFVRGLDEGRDAESVKNNRARVSLARELTREWAQAGLTKRVSELNLEDLNDVRVQLAGRDAAVEVRLGREDFGKRFRQSLEVLDAQRQTPRGPYIVGVDVSQGKRAVISTGPTAQYRPDSDAPAAAEAEAAPDPADTPVDAAPQPPAAAARAAAPRATAETARPATKEQKKAAAATRPAAKAAGRKPDAQQQTPASAAVRPRRVG